MADLLKIGSLYTQVAYESDPFQKIGSVYTQVAYEETPKLNVSKVNASFAYVESAASINVSKVNVQFAYVDGTGVQVSQVFEQFAYSETPALEVSQVFEQFAYSETPQLQVSEAFMQFAYVYGQSRTEAGDGGGIVGGEVEPTWILGTTIVTEVMTGGSIAGGTASVNLLATVTADGGAVVGGTAAIEILSVGVYASEGGAIIGGTTVPAYIFVPSVSGGAVVGGTVSFVGSYEATGIGGAIVGGHAPYLQITTITVGGGSIAGAYCEPQWIDDLPDDDEFNRDNIRQIVKARANGVYIRLRLAGSAVADVTFIGASIGNRSGNTEDFSGAPTRLTFNGGNNGVILPRSGYVYTDWVAFTVVKNTNYLFHMALEDATNWLKVKQKGQLAEYYKLASTNDTLVEDISDYSTSTAATAVISFESTASQIGTKSVSGGAIVGGTAGVTVSYAPTVSEGAIAGGAASVTGILSTLQTYIAAAFGGCIGGGAAAYTPEVSIPVGGGAVVGGAVVPHWFHVMPVVGGSIGGGLAAWLKLNHFYGDGGSLGGGISPYCVTVIKDADGGGIGGDDYQYYPHWQFKFVDTRIRPHWHDDGRACNPVWDFTEQPNKWGYLNNPNWDEADSKPVNYDGNPEDEPIVWTMKDRKF